MNKEGIPFPQTISSRIFNHIGSPQGLGKARNASPNLNIPIKRKALTANGELKEQEIILTKKIGSGLGGIVYKGIYEEKAIVEKFSADLPLEGSKSFAKKFMELQFLIYRQSLPSYRTNFYAAMVNHYASLIIYDAGEFEFGSPFVPHLEYTCYEKESGGYVFAYEFIEGRPIHPGQEEHLLKRNLKVWKDFIADKLGLWGIGRQSDACNINSAANVFIIDEATKAMKLIDVTPGVIGGQIYFLPLEIEYFFKGLLTGNFLPFGDAVDMEKLDNYRKNLQEESNELSEKYGKKRLSDFENNCRMFEFYLKKWRDCEYALVRSPVRVFQCLFNRETIKATTLNSITGLEYKGVLPLQKASFLREKVEKTNKRAKLMLLRLLLLFNLLSYLIRRIPSYLWAIVRFLFRDILWGMIKVIYKSLIFIVKVYINKEYRKRVSREKIEKWIDQAEFKDRAIDKKDADCVRSALKDKDILEIIELGPLWTIAKLIKPPFVGTIANLGAGLLFIKTLNPYWLLVLFGDGIIRFVITVIFTGFKYRMLLGLSLIPTLGFIIPIPTQLILSAPCLTEFIMHQVIGVKLGTLVPGVDRHSFRTYFYIRLMNIPLFFMNILAWPFKKI
jgi:hypothetical protein